MDCKICGSNLVKDNFGQYCPTEYCASIDGLIVSDKERQFRKENKKCLACNNCVTTTLSSLSSLSSEFCNFHIVQLMKKMNNKSHMGGFATG